MHVREIESEKELTPMIVKVSSNTRLFLTMSLAMSKEVFQSGFVRYVNGLHL